MRRKILTYLLFIFAISTLTSQNKVKSKISVKKSGTKSIVKKETIEDASSTETTPIVEENTESNPLKIKYRRISLYTMMLDTPNLPYADSIKKYFVTSRIPDKFNNHNLDKRVVQNLVSANPKQNNLKTINENGKPSIGVMPDSFTSNSLSPASSVNNLSAILSNTQTAYYKEYMAERKRLELEAKEIGVTKKSKIEEYINKRVVFDNARQQKEIEDALPQDIKDQIKANQKGNSDIARELVAKWFNRSEKGGFSMNLIRARGNYDASVLDIAKARASKRGLSMLGDAGEELIKNTFVLINEFKYTNKEEVAKKQVVY